MQNKRFIAAALCPACNSRDTIYTYEQDEAKWRACASCDFNEALNEKNNRAQELPTRVNQARLGEPVLAHETVVETVKLIDPNKT